MVLVISHILNWWKYSWAAPWRYIFSPYYMRLFYSNKKLRLSNIFTDSIKFTNKQKNENEHRFVFVLLWPDNLQLGIFMRCTCDYTHRQHLLIVFWIITLRWMSGRFMQFLWWMYSEYWIEHWTLSMGIIFLFLCFFFLFRENDDDDGRSHSLFGSIQWNQEADCQSVR